MLIDTMFARDMYQVYEINDDWLIDIQDITENTIILSTNNTCQSASVIRHFIVSNLLHIINGAIIRILLMQRRKQNWKRIKQQI